MGAIFNTGFKLKVIDLSNDTQVNASGGTNSQTLQPTTGKVYEIVGIAYHAADPPASTSGSHNVEFIHMGETASGTNAIYRPILVSGNTGSYIDIGQNNQFTGDSEQPSGLNNQQKLMHQGFLTASNDYPITIKYTNNTDVNQTGTRTCKILVKEYNEID